MLSTLASFKLNQFKMDSVQTEQDDILTDCLTAASKMIADYCDQPLEQATETIYFSARSVGAERLTDAERILGAPGYAIKEVYYTVPVTSPVLYSRNLPTDSWASAGGTVVVYKDGYVNKVYSSAGFTSTFYKLVLTVGFASNEIPDSLRLAAEQLAAEIYKMSQSGESRLGVSSISITQGGLTSTKYFTSVFERIKPHIDLYKLRTF